MRSSTSQPLTDHHVHRGIIHRDLKPANILITLPDTAQTAVQSNRESKVMIESETQKPGISLIITYQHVTAM